MSTVTEAVERARDLLVQGSSSTADPISRASIAAEMDELINAVKQAGNTSFSGRYVFAGTRTDQPPYIDGAVDAYQGTAAVVARQVGPGVSLEIGVTGESFLGNGGGDGKLLDTLRGISSHLRSGDTASMQGTDLQRIDANLDELLGVRALNGARQNRLDAALSRMGEIEEATTLQLSETEDADIAATLIELTSQQNAYQAALKVGANVIQASLMDFLR
jgi:flagellar hook-associated protein 3 FlgL